jgi:peroxiredoxin
MTNKTRIGIFTAIALIALTAYGYLSDSNGASVARQEKSTQKSEERKEEKKYQKAPDFTLQNLAGESVSLSDFRGKVVFVNFWATWCPPCRQEVPAFIELQETYGKDKLAILGISVDRGDLSVVPAFVEEYGVNYEILYHNQEVVMMYGGISSIPTTFIVDQDGNVRDGRMGYPGKEWFVRAVETLL